MLYKTLMVNCYDIVAIRISLLQAKSRSVQRLELLKAGYRNNQDRYSEVLLYLSLWAQSTSAKRILLTRISPRSRREATRFGQRLIFRPRGHYLTTNISLLMYTFLLKWLYV